MSLSTKCVYKPAHFLVGRVFANDSGNRGSIQDRIIPKIQKMVLDISLLNTHHYNVPGVKWNNPGKGVALPLYLSVTANEKGAYGSPSTTVTNLLMY